jgi:uncharacterized membrane protein YeaQ/YmgE (transglycosylase-associated protein family)
MALIAIGRRARLFRAERRVCPVCEEPYGFPFVFSSQYWSKAMGILWTVVIGFVAGIIAKFLHPGPNEPSGFILTTILGIVGAFVATFLGQALGWYRPDQGAGLIGAVVGAVIVLFIWSILARRNTTTI